MEHVSGDSVGHAANHVFPSSVAPAPAPSNQVSAGPFHGLFSIKIPKFLSDIFDLPRDTGELHVAKIAKVRTNEPISIRDIPTCTSDGIFKPLVPGQHPRHPVIEFMRPVHHVHVRMTNEFGRILWDASYDLQGGRFLDNRVNEAIPNESPVPDYIPACVLSSKSRVLLEVDAEEKAPIHIDFFNPNNKGEAARYREVLLKSRPPESNVPQQNIRSSDAVVCTVNKVHPKKEQVLIDSIREEKPEVYLPQSLSDQIWRLNRSREESSDLNPHGVPMLELSGDREKAGTVIDPELAKMAPTVIGSGKNAVHLIPRRPPIGGEIQVDQLERSTFHIFDSRNMPKHVHDADRTAILRKPGGFHQPSVNRTVYSPMWQGVHAKIDKKSDPAIHPSFQFKHPAIVAHVRLTDLTDKRLLWDAYFNVGRNHKIAVDQAPVGGSFSKFSGINPPTGKYHVYSMSVDVDNPADVLANSPDRVVDMWRYAEFIFGANRPSIHSEVDIWVEPEPALTSVVRS